MTNLQLQNTWFYKTAISHDIDLQDVFIKCDAPDLDLHSQALLGTVGVLKTMAAVKLCSKYCKQLYLENNNYWHYTLEPDFITQKIFRQLLNDREFGTPELKTKAFYRLLELESTPFLVFDEIQCEKLSDYHKGQLDTSLLDFFGKRWANRKKFCTIVTSNNSQREIESYYSEAVCSRLFGLCKVVNIKGKDKRRSV